jgi:hypothetical protein
VSDTTEACPSCGHVNSPDATFCTECGAILPPRRTGRAAPPSEPSLSPVQAGEPFPPRFRGSRALIVAAAVAIVVLAGILIAVQRHRGSRPIPMPDATPTEATPPATEATAPPSPTKAVASPTAQPRRAPADADERPPRTPAPRAEPAQPRSENAGAGWYRVRYRAPLFRDPSETSPVLAYLPAGSKVRVTRVLPGFLAVESVTGKPPGYLSSDDASPEGEP